MRRTKIAPTLHWLLHHDEDEEANETFRAADRELRALLAVARAAQRYRESRFAFRMASPEQREPGHRIHDVFVGDEYRNDRSLARLRSVSAGKRGSK